MIAYLKGKIKFKNADSVILEVAGIGYQVFTTAGVLEKTKPAADLELFIFHYLRDNAVELYGFNNQEELEFFKQLFSVNGVGPRMALAIISNLKMDQVKTTIIQGDASLLQSVSGVGAKTAERIVLDLKNKISLDSKESFSAQGEAGQYNDLIEALVGLGYSRSEAARLSQAMPADLKSIEEKVKHALKHANQNS